MIEHKNIPYYISAIGLFIILKYLYTIADISDLIFLLEPTNLVVKFLTGAKSVFIQDSGYYFQQLDIIIDKSCAGFNFWLLCFLMLVFLSLKYFEKVILKISAFIFSFIGAYIFTVLVNSSRIFVSVIIQKQAALALPIKEKIIHEGIGILTNLTFLILIYLITERILKTRNANAKLT
ncbi:exosortase K [Limibacter armeniacum]|uniref:exosortase K n=1 Tax=Limibacter armeniacum TaxID=466084 RepID=UPI0038CBFB30